MLTANFIIKVNDSYYAGESEDTVPTPRPKGGWYCNRSESSVLIFMNDIENAKVIESLTNLNSHWQRIYNSMRYDDLKASKIEIILVE